jgi:hypothetical protein
VVPRYASIAEDHDPALCGIALDHDPALCGIARDFFVWNLYVDPALCGIAQDQNSIARDQWIKLWSYTVHSIKNSFIGDFPNTTATK